jgi:hypothetical protein
MSSRLSSVLVTHGLLSVSELCATFVWQVLRGGALDTLLLERGVLEEAALLRAISAATGHPPLHPRLLLETERELAARLPLERAQALGVCPLCWTNGKLALLVSDQVDSILLEELSYELGCELAPHAATELRLVQARGLIYGQPLPARFAALLARVGTRPCLALTRLRPAPERPAGVLEAQLQGY